MPDSRTVLPAPKLLNLIGVRADENAITLVARTSSRVARCPACANDIGQGPLPVREDAGRPALAGSPRNRSPARPKVLL